MSNQALGVQKGEIQVIHRMAGDLVSQRLELAQVRPDGLILRAVHNDTHDDDQAILVEGLDHPLEVGPEPVGSKVIDRHNDGTLRRAFPGLTQWQEVAVSHCLPPVLEDGLRKRFHALFTECRVEHQRHRRGTGDRRNAGGREARRFDIPVDGELGGRLAGVDPTRQAGFGIGRGLDGEKAVWRILHPGRRGRAWPMSFVRRVRRELRISRLRWIGGPHPRIGLIGQDQQEDQSGDEAAEEETVHGELLGALGSDPTLGARLYRWFRGGLREHHQPGNPTVIFGLERVEL